MLSLLEERKVMVPKYILVTLSLLLLMIYYVIAEMLHLLTWFINFRFLLFIIENYCLTDDLQRLF